MFRLKQPAPRSCWLVGHRGAMAYAPENTMASFLCAQKMGAEFLECDIHLTREKTCVLMHDETVSRTTNGTGYLQDLTLDAVRALDAGSWFSPDFQGEKVPTLEELLQWAKNQTSLTGFQLGLAIELKNGQARASELPDLAVDQVSRAGMESRVVVVSYDQDMLKRVKALNQRIATGILYKLPLEHPFKLAKELDADALFPRRHLLTKELIAQAHNRGIAVATWAVDDPAEMREFLSWNVDAIATNVPDRLNEILNSKPGSP